MFPSWLAHVPGLRTALPRRDRRPKATRPRRPPLRVEALEDRSLPASFLVTSNLDDGSTGTLRWAIDQANLNPGPDQIEFDELHLFATQQTITLDPSRGALGATGELNIVGPGFHQVIIDGNGPLGFYCAGKVSLYQLDVENCHSSAEGGGILNYGTLTVFHCTINDNSGLLAGGIENYGTLIVNQGVFYRNTGSAWAGAIDNAGSATIINSTFGGNSNSDELTGAIGRAGAVYNGGQMAVDTCHFEANTSASIYNSGTLTAVTNSDFDLNSGSAYDVSNTIFAPDGSAVSLLAGSGVFNYGGTADISGCIFNGNTGACLYNGKSYDNYYNGGTAKMTVRTSTFFENQRDAYGMGAALANFADTTMSGCTFTDNYGGCIYNGADGLGVGMLTVNNSNFGPHTYGDIAYPGNTGAFYSNVSLLDGTIYTARVGSGIYNEHGATADISGCTFSDNTGTPVFNLYDPATMGPAVTSVTIADSTFSDNEAFAGGGLWNYGGKASVRYTTFSHNFAYLSAGGAINDFSGGTLDITDSTLSGNTSGYNKLGQVSFRGGWGGGLSVTSGATATVTNCTIADNRALGFGGGIFMFFATLKVINSTIAGLNHVDTGAGGGLYSGPGATTLGNTIVAGNTAPANPDLSAAVTSLGHNLVGNIVGSGGITNGVNGDLAGTADNPINSQLAPLGYYGGPTPTMPLLPGSPAIDKGGNALAVDAWGNPLTADQRGLPRMVGASVDIGAVEDQMLAGPGTDGISDSGQVNVTIVPNAVTGADVTLESPLGTNLAAISVIDPPPGLPTGAKTPVGTFDLRVGGLAPAGTTTVTLTLPAGVKVNQYWKYGVEPVDNPTTPLNEATTPHWWDFKWDATTGTGAKFVNAGKYTTQIILTFVDGGRGDEDGTANGIVVDPGAPVFVPIQVQIDVRSTVNLASQGVIAVAILSSADFDAATVDPTTVRFAGASAVQWFLQDVDGDGRLDLVLNFRTQDTDLRAVYAQLLADDIDTDGVLDSTHQEASVGLTGSTTDGQQVEGSDTLDLFLSGKALRDLLCQLAATGQI